MSSNSRSPKARHRFSFSGPLMTERKDKVTVDDILASLTRQAEFKQECEKEDRLALADIAEEEDLSRIQGFSSEPKAPSIMERKTDYGRLLFVFMVLTGLAVAWLYSSISKPFDLAALTGIIQKSGVRSIFANAAQLGIMALAGLVGALWIRRKRLGSSQQFMPL